MNARRTTKVVVRTTTKEGRRSKRRISHASCHGSVACRGAGIVARLANIARYLRSSRPSAPSSARQAIVASTRDLSRGFPNVRSGGRTDLSSFVLFSPRTYLRLIERYNDDVWPLQFVAMAVVIAIAFWRARSIRGHLASFRSRWFRCGCSSRGRFMPAAMRRSTGRRNARDRVRRRKRCCWRGLARRAAGLRFERRRVAAATRRLRHRSGRARRRAARRMARRARLAAARMVRHCAGPDRHRHAWRPAAGRNRPPWALLVIRCCGARSTARSCGRSACATRSRCRLRHCWCWRRGLRRPRLDHLVCPHDEVLQRVRTERRRNRDIRAASRPRAISTRPIRGMLLRAIERVPAPAEIGLEPGGEIHRAVRRRDADVAEIAGAVARRNVHAAAERDRRGARSRGTRRAARCSASHAVRVERACS